MFETCEFWPGRIAAHTAAAASTEPGIKTARICKIAYFMIENAKCVKNYRVEQGRASCASVYLADIAAICIVMSGACRPGFFNYSG
ncbi:MAG: hypothetical protein LBV27_09695 [Oscillospiraceae bacterium]|jgi:methionine aminopeptidase|nr:hypothetical protein [Oscillospiraceae bacterium]